MTYAVDDHRSVDTNMLLILVVAGEQFYKASVEWHREPFVQVPSSDNARLMSLTRSETDAGPIEMISNPRSLYVRS
jgi:hypothetical protein